VYYGSFPWLTHLKQTVRPDSSWVDGHTIKTGSLPWVCNRKRVLHGR